MILNNPDHRLAIARQRQVRPSASTTKSALLLQKPDHYCLCSRRSLEFSTNQDIINIVKLALLLDTHTTNAVATLAPQLFTLSTRCSNSK